MVVRLQDEGPIKLHAVVINFRDLHISNAPGIDRRLKSGIEGLKREAELENLRSSSSVHWVKEFKFVEEIIINWRFLRLNSWPDCFAIPIEIARHDCHLN